MVELVSYEPATGEALWKGAAASPADVDATVAAARQAFPAWACASLEDRIERLKAFQATVRERADAFAELIARETGKPLWDAKGEVATVAAKVDISIDAHAQRTGLRLQAADGVRQTLRHRPHGVLAVLGPYNFPAHLPNGQITPALLAGNTVVFKPSELTPASAEFMIACWRDSGLPEGVLGLVQGAGDTGRALAGHSDIDGLLFVGSAATGAALHRQFADMPHKILALEMGGNNPLIWWDGADLDAAAQVVVQSAYLSSGQRCTCARRLILPEHMAGPALEALTALVDRIIVGAPLDQPQPFMGPVIDMRAADSLASAFAELTAQGGKVVRELARPRPGLPFVSPAVIDVTEVAAPPDQERFGPLLQVIRVGTRPFTSGSGPGRGPGW
jgi:succinylglutamic semialdehyde dehydrogenase